MKRLADPTKDKNWLRSVRKATWTWKDLRTWMARGKNWRFLATYIPVSADPFSGIVEGWIVFPGAFAAGVVGQRLEFGKMPFEFDVLPMRRGFLEVRFRVPKKYFFHIWSACETAQRFDVYSHAGV